MRAWGKPLCLMCACISLAFAAGCGEAPPENYQRIGDGRTVEYSTSDAIDPQQYTTYVDKEIGIVMNLLSSHVSNGDSILRGKYLAADELASLENSIDMTQEAIESVEVLHAPNKYEDERAVILRKLASAKSSLEAYRDALNGTGADIQSCIDLMQGDWVALSASYNLVWE